MIPGECVTVYHWLRRSETGLGTLFAILVLTLFSVFLSFSLFHHCLPWPSSYIVLCFVERLTALQVPQHDARSPPETAGDGRDDRVIRRFDNKIAYHWVLHFYREVQIIVQRK